MANTVHIRTISRYQAKVLRGGISLGPKNRRIAPFREPPSFDAFSLTTLADGDGVGFLLVEKKREADILELWKWE